MTPEGQKPSRGYAAWNSDERCTHNLLCTKHFHGVPFRKSACTLVEITIRKSVRIVYWKINDLRVQTFLFSVICDRAL